MSDKTKIEWTDATWNPVTGCSRVSAGCANCYAETFANRWKGLPGHYFTRGFEVTLRPEKLDQPLRWKRPRRIFVNSMSDLFHDDVPFEFIDKVFAVMALAPQHTFQVLTKRPARMLEYFNRRKTYQVAFVGGTKEFTTCQLVGMCLRTFDDLWRTKAENLAQTELGCSMQFDSKPWPLPNVWLGVSVENQKAADERIPLLLQTPAAVRFLSCEPLLGPVDLDPLWLRASPSAAANSGRTAHLPLTHWANWGSTAIDWVIAGGESGPGARPMHPDWARGLLDQCEAAGTPFFFKQWGEFVPCGMVEDETKFKNTMLEGTIMCRVGKASAGAMLDGREHKEFPAVHA